MSLAIIYSRAQLGVDAPLITVEVHLSNGLPGLSIVGMPETAVKESKDRVRSAILNSHLEFPARRITINLAPADLPKEGGRYDLAIALGILAASGQIPDGLLTQHEFVGELALSGELRAVKGTLPAALACGTQQRTLVVPLENGAEAALARSTPVLQAKHLLDVCAHFLQRAPNAAQVTQDQSLAHAVPLPDAVPLDLPDLAEVRGQQAAKRALEIAAAGGHNILFFGPPGTGKTMLASRLAGILPPLSDSEAMEVAAIASLSTGATTWRQRPFRAPHHTASAVALVGGGSTPRPGEISLAHHGVLFLDELPEFQRRVLEVLREPLESGHISISRANAQVDFPAQFQLIAAMNPCACGFLGDREGRCRCTPDQVRRYRDKISGPLLDRIDLHVQVPALKQGELTQPATTPVYAGAETSQQVRERVLAARERQLVRNNGIVNARLNNRALGKHCVLDDKSRALLERGMERLGLSARAYHRILKMSRTIADLAGAEHITTPHVAEAMSYRLLDRGPST